MAAAMKGLQLLDPKQLQPKLIQGESIHMCTYIYIFIYTSGACVQDATTRFWRRMRQRKRKRNRWKRGSEKGGGEVVTEMVKEVRKNVGGEARNCGDGGCWEVG